MIHLVIPAGRVALEGRRLVIDLAAPDAERVACLLSRKRSVDIVLKTWYARRKSGRGSQSNHLHGHLAQIADSLGYDAGEFKVVMKQNIPTWPSKEVTVSGHAFRVYESESKVNTLVESAAIEWCHRIAAEYNIKLDETPYMGGA